MADQILHTHLEVLKMFTQLKDVEPVQFGTFRQFNILTFSFKNNGQDLEKSIIVYMKDSEYTERQSINIEGFEIPIDLPLSAIEVIQYRYGNSEYAGCFNIDPAELFSMDLNQVEAYSLDVFDRLNKHYLRQL